MTKGGQIGFKAQLWIPSEVWWSYLQANAEQTTIGNTVRDATLAWPDNLRHPKLMVGEKRQSRAEKLVEALT